MKTLMMLGMVAAGGLAGFGWAKLVGCPDGGCPLTATPWRGAVWGLVMGAVFALSMLPSGCAARVDESTLPGNDAIVHVKTTAEFDALLAGGGTPVLVDFYADWCGPCRMFAPELAKFADTHRGAVTVVKVNVDDHPELARRYDVTGIPAVLLFQHNKLVRQTSGAMTAAAVEAWVKGGG